MSYHKNQAIRQSIPIPGFPTLERKYAKGFRELFVNQIHKTLTQEFIGRCIAKWESINKAQTEEEIALEDFIIEELDKRPYTSDESKQTRDLVDLLLLLYISSIGVGIVFDKTRFINLNRAIDDSRISYAIAQTSLSGFNLTNEKVLRELELLAQAKILKINSVTKERLKNFLKREIKSGKSIVEITKLIRKLDQIHSRRAWNTSRTELIFAKGIGSEQYFRRRGLERSTWSCKNPQDAGCLVNCGTTRVLGESFPSGHGAPPVHPNCICFLDVFIPRDIVGLNIYIQNVNNGYDWNGD